MLFQAIAGRLRGIAHIRRRAPSGRGHRPLANAGQPRQAPARGKRLKTQRGHHEINRHRADRGALLWRARPRRPARNPPSSRSESPAPLHRNFQPDLFLERRGRLRPHRLHHLPEGPRAHRRPEHPAGQGIAAHCGELSGRRILGDPRRQPAKAGKREVAPGARLRALPAARRAQGVGAAHPAVPHRACVHQVQRAGGLRQRDEPPGLPARLAGDRRRTGTRPGLSRSEQPAAGTELSRSERLEHPRGQRRGGRVTAGRGARPFGLPRHQGRRRYPRLLRPCISPKPTCW